MDEMKHGADEIVLAPETIPSDEVAAEDSVPHDEMVNEDVTVMVEAEPKQAVRVNEILELRQSNRKVFRMSDGTEQAVFYPNPVHVFDENTNTFDDVDDSFVEEKDGRHFVSGKNHFKARFNREEENDELFSLESGVHRVTVSAKKNSKQRNKGVKPQVHQKMADGVKKMNALVFANVHNGADYEYAVTGNGVKENIVVKEKADVYRYPFVLHMENVTAAFDDVDKRIVFVSTETGEEVFFIPAPFMTDALGVVSTAVSYEVKTTANGDMVLNVVADSAWMNAEERVFPVCIDPQVQVSGVSAMNTYSWENGVLSNATAHTVGVTDSGTVKRMYMSFNMPTLPRNPRIKKAELKFYQAPSASACNDGSKLGLYRVTDNLSIGNCNPTHSANLIDFAKIRTGHDEDDEVISYTFDVTTLMDQVNKGEEDIKDLVLKMLDENPACNNSITLCGSAYAEDDRYVPQLVVTYESTYGVNTSYRTHTHELGRFGQGSIDLQCGNLMFESEDFAWSGNRMPVTIKHLYNSALSAYPYTANSEIKLPTANFAAMKIGNGFKLNVMQSMKPDTFQYEGSLYDGYVYIGENGEETYFKQSTKKSCCDSNTQCYNLYEDVNGDELMYDPEKRILKLNDDEYLFDMNGRLIRITDAAGNHMDITYTADRITVVTDGAGREFEFGYDEESQLKAVKAPDGTLIKYTYTNHLLTDVIYPDGKKVVIDYTSDKPAMVTLSDAADNAVYKVAYTFTGDRLKTVTEYGSDGATGAQTTYDYSVASGRTMVTTTEQADEDEEAKDIVTVYTFDDAGTVISEYIYSKDMGKVGATGEESGIHPHSGDGGAGVVSNINNLLLEHNFETLTQWESMLENAEDFAKCNTTVSCVDAKFGVQTLRMQSYQAECRENGMYQETVVLPAGQYTYSAYLQVCAAFEGTDAGAYIRVVDVAGNVLGISERLVNRDTEYTRLIVPFELTSAQKVQVQILVNGQGVVYADAAQLENNPYANAYNMLENGNFELNSGWSLNGGSCTDSERFNMNRSMMITGDLDTKQNVSQKVLVKTAADTRETFVLSGWAKGYGLPNHERDDAETPTFRLRAEIKYSNAETETSYAEFSPCTSEWQLASVEFAKQKCKEVECITVYCEYDHNVGVVYFDDIQLVRSSLETKVTDFDTTDGTTQSATNDTTGENEENDAPAFEEVKDVFGNALTETTFTDGEFGTIYRAFGFTPNGDCVENAGNDLVSETDARGNVTHYTVDEETSRNEEVFDRCGNKTAYEYDASGKTTKVISKDAEGNELANVSYVYDAFDNMTKIVRGDGMKYALAYNQFHNLESIGVEGVNQPLIKYAYKNGNGRLKQMTYANGHTMKAIYNGIGQMVAEKWFESEAQAADSTATPIAHYKYVYDGDGNIVRSIDIVAKKEYNYQYESGKLVRATEADVEFSGEIVTAKVVVNTIRYCYDSEDKMTKKVIVPATGTEQTIYYETTDDNTVVKFSVDGKTVTSHSKTDSFGRKVFDELQLGTGFVSRQFQYHAGEVTDQHKDSAKLKSSATTQLVSQIVLSDGRTISYEYDEEERITKVDDSVDGITTYTYDALGQLVEEKYKAADAENYIIVNAMTYDNYGNIKTKNGVEYVYGDEDWKDLLTSYNGQSITYDAQGNPISYLGHTLAWEKGRQLKQFTKEDGTVISYTYNANGIRTSKTVAGVKHEFVLDGTKILRETWGGNTLTPLYDNENSVCGILYNNVPYYFIKNLQGDVIAMVDKNAQTVARYTYDAWGVCTIVTDTSGVDIATINPFRYRCYYYDAEIGLYYLQSRYYDANTGRFVNADEVLFGGIGGTVISFDFFHYCKNNSVNYVDYGGFMAVAVLRMLSNIYNAGIINDSTVSLSTLALNGLGLYTAFHEIAQLNIAKKLEAKGFRNITLEQYIRGKGEADIVATKRKKYVWEVKPLGTSPNSQLVKYSKGTGYNRGYNIGKIDNIAICGKVKMCITFDSSGGAYYAFYVRGKRVTNSQLHRALKAIIVVACAVAVSIILATILEDILTFGAGIWNDAPSFLGAAGSMSGIVVGGLRAVGYA